LNCVECGPKVEKIEQVPSKAPYTKRFEDRVGQACESAAARRVARQFGLPESTVRAIDLRYLERWAAKRRKAPLKQLGVDEIYMGEKIQFVTVASNLETGEPLWLGRERKRETLDEFFRPNYGRRNAGTFRRPVWTCGSRSPPALRNGRRSARSYTTSFIST